MIVATVQSTTRQNGGHQRVLATNLLAVLPQILEPVTGEPSDEQPRGDSHPTAAITTNAVATAHLGHEDARAAIGNGEADVHRSDETRPNA